jgi:hypothetical protein
MSNCTKEGTAVIARVKFGVNDIGFFFGPFGVATHQKHAQGHARLRNIAGDEEFTRWMGLKALGHSVTNFTQLVDACIRMLEHDNKKNSFRIEIMRPMTISLDYQGLREGFEDDVEYPKCVS